MPGIERSAVRNRLLAALPPGDLAALAPALERVELGLKQVLHLPGQRVSALHFPEGGLVSHVVPLEDGRGAEVGVVGSEGLVGLAALGSCACGVKALAPIITSSRATLEGPEVAKRSPRRKQYAALPLAERDGQPVVMLITSRETRRWVIPKGNPEKGLKPHALAAKEAYEEAGLVGKVGTRPLGRYSYGKRFGPKKVVPCEVDVFPLAVERQLDDWPERGQRETRWFTPGEAALLVDEGGLVELLLGLASIDA